MHFEIFCHVVDNYGDAGVLWRLTRQLIESGEAQSVRLLCDQPELIERLGGQPLQYWQSDQRLQLQHWKPDDNAAVTKHADAPIEFLQRGGEPQCVIAGFGTRLPRDYINAMANTAPAPVWINLEYLSAEDWVQDCHALPSPDPQTGFVQWAWFPGFTPRTGGLVFDSQKANEIALFEPIMAENPRYSLIFSYENDALNAWIRHACCAAQNERDEYKLCIAQGAGARGLQSFISGLASPEHTALNQRLRWLPFAPQSQFDQWLQGAQWAVVRGEDSFVQAQALAVPFLWHIYPQTDGVHLTKLQAFLNLYCAQMPAALRELHVATSLALNAHDGTNDTREFTNLMPQWLAQLDLLSMHAQHWAAHLAQTSNARPRLVQFIENQLKSKA